MVLILIVLYCLLPSTVFILFLIDLPFFGLLDTLNYIFSIFSYFLILNHILITCKLPWMQRRIPYDKMVKFHVISGTFIIIAIYSHAAYKILTGKHIDLLTWILLGLFSILYLLAILWIDAPGVRNIREVVLQKIKKERLHSYDRSKTLHGYFFVLLAILAFLHIREAGVLNSSFAFNAIVPILYPVIVLGLFFYSKIRKRSLPKLRLTTSEQYHDTSVLTFSQIKSGKKIPFRAGQFGYLRWEDKNFSSEEHPFSFLSTPGDDHISMAIKNLGDYTENIKDIPIGSIARINGGFGDFIPDFSKGKVCLIGSGIGIVPILSLIQGLRENRPKYEVLCFIAVNSRDELLLEESITSIVEEVPELTLHIQVFEEDHILYSEEYFRERIPNPSEFSYYLCSSMGVRRLVMEAVSNMDVPKNQFHFEAFSF